MLRKILCAGLAVADIIARPVNETIFSTPMEIETPRLGPGGDALNQAIVLRRLGMDCALSAAVGRDFWGDFLMGVMEREGIGPELVRRIPDQATTTCLILIDPTGERHFLTSRHATETYALEPGDALRDYDIISIASLWGLAGMTAERIHALSRYTRAHGKLLVTDFTDDTRGMGVPYALSVLPDFDYLLPSYSEAVLLADGEREPERILTKLKERGARNIVLKLGKDGCIADIGGRLYRQESLAREIADTTGAGDNFAATFLACLMKDIDPQTSLRLASRAAARNVAAIGATGARYTFEDLLREDRG